MTRLSEGDLQITFPAGTSANKFDGTNHALSHCMKAVDFIVELTDRMLFVELKDPDDPQAPAAERERYLGKFSSGALDADLKAKYRDSYLYEWASGRATKPIYYLVLIGAAGLTPAELLARTEALQRQIPIMGPGGIPWKRPFAAGCAVMNLRSWNAALPTFPATRLSA